MSQKYISTIAKSYALALIQSGSGSLDLIKSELSDVIATIRESSDLKVVMNNCAISTGKKLEIIESVFGGKVSGKVLNVLKILVEKNRFNELNSIYQAYIQMLEVNSNKKHVDIISSIELNTELKDKIVEKLHQKLNCDVIPNWQIDESIIAGLEFRFDDYVIDSSVRTKLKVLGKNISR
mgnify:CR=1 FL=1